MNYIQGVEKNCSERLIEWTFSNLETIDPELRLKLTSESDYYLTNGQPRLGDAQYRSRP